MSDNVGEFGKRIREDNLWDDDTIQDEQKKKIDNIPTNKKFKIDSYDSNKNNSYHADEEEEMLFGNKISLNEPIHLKTEKTITELTVTTKQTKMIEISQKEIDIIKLEISHYEKDIEKNGFDSLSSFEKNEYENKKKLINQLQKSDLNDSYLLPDDYVTKEGRIDINKKEEILMKKNKYERKEREQEWIENQINRAQQVNQLTKLKKDENIKDETKEYEYVFDKSQMINYIPDEDTKELEDKIELEELIEQEEKRVHSIEETKKSLPVYQYRDELLEAVKKYPVLIVVGETGSGKTTQLPQYLHEAGYTKDNKMIGCTQPRRVAAVSVASRVSDEIGTKLGDKVGYSIRFDEKSSKNTVIKYMTDGMLVREFLTDNTLDKYSVMIIDEAHERTLSTDILLGLLKDLLKKRPNFKLIISSATINAKKFSDYFNSAPIFNVPGRRYPVEIFYTEHPEANYLYAAITTVFQIHMSQKNSGDILVFLTGQEEIEKMAENLRETCKKLEGQIKEMIICPIYSNLPPEQQKKIFEPTPKNSRKIVISTNIAETSLTIDGIVYVIDCGFVKENIFNVNNGMESLEIIPCSKASADQRAGRAGRVGPGKCFRLYTKWSYLNELPRNPIPEILRVDLTTVVLLMMTLGITDLIHFDFMDKPSTKALIKALELLYALGALNENGELTNIGIKMAMFPTKPMLSKSLLESYKLKCCNEMISIAAMLEDTNSLFIFNKEKKEMVKNIHSKFQNKIGGDHLTLLEIWNQFKDSGYSPQWCHDHFLQYKTLIKAKNIKKQLERICKRFEIIENDENNNNNNLNYNQILINVMKSITAGYFTQSAKLSQQGNNYLTLSKKQSVVIHPSSTLYGAVPPAKFVLYNELVMTSKEFMRHVMPVQSKWLAQYGRNYFNQKELN